MIWNEHMHAIDYQTCALLNNLSVTAQSLISQQVPWHMQKCATTNVTLGEAYLVLVGKIRFQIYVNGLYDLMKKIKTITTKIHKVIYLLEGVN